MNLNVVLEYFKRPHTFLKSRSKKMNPTIGENKISIELTNLLSASSIAYLSHFTGKPVESEYICDAVWTKIANETNTRAVTVGGKKICPFGILMRQMGKNAGAADFIFTKHNTHLWLELKAGHSNHLGVDQEFFNEWCSISGCNFEVAYSFKEAVNYLIEYKILTQNIFKNGH